MRYLGNKQKYGKEICNAIVEDITGGLFGGGRELPKNWVEPFVGSGGMIENVPPTFNRYSNDKNKYIIAMHKAVQNGWLPPDSISEDEYKDIKNNKDSYPPELVGFCGFGISFGAKWFGTYAKDNTNAQNYCFESKKAVARTSKSIVGVCFSVGEYKEIDIPDDSIVYCDPPYSGTTDGYGVGGFSHDSFYSWLKQIQASGSLVYVSGYEMPDDFIVVWERQVNCNIDNMNQSKATARTERLYKLPKER